MNRTETRRHVHRDDCPQALAVLAEHGRALGDAVVSPAEHIPGGLTVVWQVRDADVLLPVERADEWGAWLSVLIAAVHHPHVLAAKQPETDAAEVANWVLDDLVDLEDAARAAEARHHEDLADRSAHLRLSLDEPRGLVVVSPGVELVNLVAMLRMFARAVLDPGGPDALDARGPSAYVAAAWSRDLGVATGAL